MPATRTLAQMRDQALRYAGLRGFPSVVDSADHFVNARILELYDLLVSCRGGDYYAQELSTPTVASQALYTWGAFGAPDFYQLLAVYAERDGDTWELDSFDPTQKAALLRAENAGGAWHPAELHKRVRPEGVEVRPAPINGDITLTISYIPAAPRLTEDEHTFDGINGWERWAELGAAIDLRESEEEDASGLIARQMIIGERIKLLAAGRDKTRPIQRRLVDSRRRRWPPW